MLDIAQIAPPGSPEERLLEQLDPTRLPQHIAIIMDGNGRWAKSRNLPRVRLARRGRGPQCSRSS